MLDEHLDTQVAGPAQSHEVVRPVGEVDILVVPATVDVVDVEPASIGTAICPAPAAHLVPFDDGAADAFPTLTMLKPAPSPVVGVGGADRVLAVAGVRAELAAGVGGEPAHGLAAAPAVVVQGGDLSGSLAGHRTEVHRVPAGLVRLAALRAGDGASRRTAGGNVAVPTAIHSLTAPLGPWPVELDGAEGASKRHRTPCAFALAGPPAVDSRRVRRLELLTALAA